MRSLRPSQVRARILRDHASLRAGLERVAAAAALLERDGPVALPYVLAQVQSLYRELREHIDFEDELLVPALREVDAWGPVRASQLTRHHAEQRLALRALAERTAYESADGLVRLIADLIAELRADMAHEDQDLLSADLLRDDVISIDGEAG